MRHPTSPEWTDFVRAVADDGDRSILQGHLDDGCESCQAIVNALERILTTAEIDGALAPPAGAVRSVRAYFDVQQPRAVSRWSEVCLQRAFDSTLSPMVASRSASSPRRQMLFESDDYTLGLSVDYSQGEADAVLRGQLLEAHGGPRSHTPVFLVGDGEVLGRAISEEHGTFEMSGRLDQPCELWVFPDDENRIRLTLNADR
jgi:hypothetical protein